MWARRGSRPRQVRQTRYGNVWLFGAACPATGGSFGLILPKANAHAMQLWLDAFAARIEHGTHAVLVLDNAGWHRAAALRWPAGVTPLFLPPYSPELNPMENLWGWLKQTFLSNRTFDDDAAMLDAGEQAWREATPQRVRSICRRTWIDDINS